MTLTSRRCMQVRQGPARGPHSHLARSGLLPGGEDNAWSFQGPSSLHRLFDRRQKMTAPLLALCQLAKKS